MLDASREQARMEAAAGLSPFELVLKQFKFPDRIVPHPKQIEVINRSCQRQHNGEWLDMGTGKTFVETAVALYFWITEGKPTVVVMPPLLVPQWGEWLREISPAIPTLEYRGDPRERAALSFEGRVFVLVGVQIFKKEFKRFTDFYRKRKYRFVCDEATIIANVDTDNHRKCYSFAMGMDQDLLTGTPMNKPTDAYGLLKFTAPGTYRNKRHFENTHVAERDFFDNPTKWDNLDVLSQNLMINGERVLFSDMYPNTEKPLYVPELYDLAPAHLKLYNRLAEEELLRLPGGGKIDATSVQRLRHALGQIVMNHDHFSGDENDTSAGLELIGQKLDELGDGKLVVFADYRMTVASIVKKFGPLCAGQINSEVSEQQKLRAKQRFIQEAGFRLIVIQYISGGKGLDGLQHVCNTVLGIEPCLQPRDFHQAVARLYRLGQRHRVRAYMAMARGTLQVRGFNALLKNDTIVNQVVRSEINLREAIYGR